MITLFGLKTCDTCRKARRALEAAGQEVMFVDLRTDPVDGETLTRWLADLGPGLMNTRSTTWRGLDEAARGETPLNLMQTHPTLIKRPVLDVDGALYLGWGKDVQRCCPKVIRLVCDPERSDPPTVARRHASPEPPR